jgi:hypothetical protein
VTPEAVFETLFTCNGNQGIRARYRLTIPSHSTRRLLFFNDFHISNSAAISDAAVYDGIPVGLLQGLSDTQLSQVVNWTIGPISYLFLPDILR